MFAAMLCVSVSLDIRTAGGIARQIVEAGADREQADA
jgi:hypothetical protein